MSIKGGCDCNNIEVKWHTIDYSLVPRACQCDYCRSKSAAYVSKSGTRFEVVIRHIDLHRTAQHGSNSAVFHECVNCGQVVFVTAEIGGDLYGALNANHLNNKPGFPAPVKTNFSDQTAEQKRERWRQNWCRPVLITNLESDAAGTPLIQVVSGGQTGVDRGALDAALDLGAKAGGWCPEGRLAEDGILAERYPLQELPGAGYRQRTRQNVIDSDGTVIIYFGYPSGGTEQTIHFCIREKKPYLLIDGNELGFEGASTRVLEFLQLHSVSVLNVAGPRASGEPRGYAYAKKVLHGVLTGQRAA